MRLDNLHMMDIVDDKLSSEFLAASPSVTYIRYIGVDKMMINHRDVLSTLKDLAKNSPAAKKMDMNNLDDQYIFDLRRAYYP